MKKILVIAEKPSVAQDIAKVLECKKKGEGYFYSEIYIVSWAIGHLVSLCDPEDYDVKLKSWQFNTLPIIPDTIKLKATKKTKAQLNILKKLMNSQDVEKIICATDSGREGELIFRYIYQFVKCKKEFQRLWISSMTNTAIKNGFENLKPSKEYDNLFYSAKCRSEADWIVGINATRAYTLKYNTLLSIGRVQTPTLSIIVNRYKEIENFKPEKYYELKLKYKDFDALWIDLKSKSNKLLKDQAEKIENKIKNKSVSVHSVKLEEKQQAPPLLYDLTELQRDCNKKFGYSAQKTLNIAQNLYEKRKLITYPRTDSQYLSSDMIPNLKFILNRISIDKYKEYINNLGNLHITKRIVDNSKITDHHAIIPTEKVFKVNSLDKDEFNVYDLIVRRFIAVFLPNYIYNICTIITTTEDEFFISKGNSIVSLGWKQLYKSNSIDKEEDKDEVKLPKVEKNEIRQIINTNIEEKTTKPPKNYTEASLLKAMENAGRFVVDESIKHELKESGLGTPATRASIIERLISVGYIKRSEKSLIPTEKGIKLIEVVPKELKSAETTGRWEKGLNAIAKGKMENIRFMNSIKRYVNYIVDESKKSSIDINFPKENNLSKLKVSNFGICPKCKKGIILENSKAFYCSNWKTGCKYTLWKSDLDKLGIKYTVTDIKKYIAKQ